MILSPKASMPSFLAIMALLTVLFSSALHSQEEYQKNSSVRYDTWFAAGQMHIAYSFTDYRDRAVTFRVSFDSTRLVEDGNRFGIPTWVWRPHTYDFRFYQTLKDGLYVMDGRIIRADKSAMVQAYAPLYGRSIASWIVEQLKSQGEDSRENRIRATMRFVQDIPYAIPPNSLHEKYLGGLIPVPFLLGGGWGDCDSKAVLFASIMVNLIPASQVAFINLDSPAHCFNGILDSRAPGRWTLPDGMDTFVFAEATGPAHQEYGDNGFSYGSGYHLERLSGLSDLPSPLPYHRSGYASNDDPPTRDHFWWLLGGGKPPDSEWRNTDDRDEERRRKDEDARRRWVEARRQEELRRAKEEERRRNEMDRANARRRDEEERRRLQRLFDSRSRWSLIAMLGFHAASPIGTMNQVTDRPSSLRFIFESELFLGARHESGITIGAFATVGLPSPSILASGSLYPSSLDESASATPLGSPSQLSTSAIAHPYVEIEGGFLLARALRISVGRGRQYYYTDDPLMSTLIEHTDEYNVSTLALYLPVYSLSLVMTVHALWRSSFENASLRGGVGLIGRLW